MTRRKALDVDLAKVLSRLTAGYPHIGIYDVRGRKAYCARNDGPVPAIDQEHAGLFRDAAPRCPGGQGSVYMFLVFIRRIPAWAWCTGIPLTGRNTNLLVRLDPRWSYVHQTLLPAHNTRAIEANITRQLAAAEHLLLLYRQVSRRRPSGCT